MLELFVTPNMRNLIPAILLQALYDFSAGHKIRYTLFTHLSSRGFTGARWERAGFVSPSKWLSFAKTSAETQYGAVVGRVVAGCAGRDGLDVGCNRHFWNGGLLRQQAVTGAGNSYACPWRIEPRQAVAGELLIRP
jgi:hypothetical protein